MKKVLVVDDFSLSFRQCRKSLVDKEGTRYQEFVRELDPKYRIVWRDIVLGYFALFLTLATLCFTKSDVVLGLTIALLGAISIGYWITYLTLFVHEAAHHNVADAARNDRLASIFLCWFAGIDIKSYRRIHFEHHRLIGTCNDTENSYFNAPTLWFMFKTLSGVHAFKIIIKRKNRLVSDNNKRSNHFPLYYSLTLHSLILLALVFYGFWPAAMAWVLGLYAFFPFFSAMRQLLEHRDIGADPVQDYHLEPHGSIGRIFGNDVLSVTFGAAGFKPPSSSSLGSAGLLHSLSRVGGFLTKNETRPSDRG
jgi:fatty acid desaturase